MSSLLQAADSMSLKNKALFFFVLAVLLTLTVFGGICSTAGVPPATVSLALFFLLCTLVAAVLGFHFYVLKPLAEINAVTKLMTDGCLDGLNRIRRNDEIGRLGETINDLAMNMQEVLLFVWNHSQENRALMQEIGEQLDACACTQVDTRTAVQEELAKMRQADEDLKAIVLTFSYFEIRLEHERMLAESDCGQEGECCGGGAACKLQ
jgi:uncharacterized membrane protein YtjA (UPF0391 family)